MGQLLMQASWPTRPWPRWPIGYADAWMRTRASCADDAGPAMRMSDFGMGPTLRPTMQSREREPAMDEKEMPKKME